MEVLVDVMEVMFGGVLLTARYTIFKEEEC